MQGHIPGSLLAPLNKQFNTVVGSYVEADKNICLVIDEGSVEQAVRDLVRVGLDNIKGFTTPEDLKLYFESGGMSDQIKTIDLKKTAKLYDSEEFAVLDVRKATEFAEGHIPNAINIAHIRLKAELDSLSADKTLIVHCRSGARAAIASSMLRRGDFDVLYVDDHIDNWPEAASMLSK